LRAFLWRQGAKEETLRAANRLSVFGLIFLASAMTGAIFLITDVLFGGVVAAVATVAIGAVFAWVWYGQPASMHRTSCPLVPGTC
jgi:membrane associated rhomboid family serine protease